MKAAVLYSPASAPRYADFAEPTPAADEELIYVRAAALTPLAKALASGAHYASHASLPAICGIDGVGVLADGSRVYFGGPRAPYGTLAERSVAPRAWSLPLPDGLPDGIAAALPNPALSSWLALVWRAQLQPGETVLVLGATGTAGRLAIQIAKHLGAGRVVAAGRNEQALQELPALGADATVALGQSDPALAAGFAREAAKQPFDVILDYVLGHPTEVLLDTLTGHDAMAEPRRTRLVQIGSSAAPTIVLPAAALRSSGLELYGSGGGSVPHHAIFETFSQVMALATSGKLQIDIEEVPLAEIEQAWQRRDLQGRRLVCIP